MEPSRQPDSWERVRSEIDRGQMGDKIAHPDPASAPLGTDEEAGGARTDPADVARSAEAERTGPLDDSRRSASGRALMIGIALAGVAIVLVLAALWATSA